MSSIEHDMIPYGQTRHEAVPKVPTMLSQGWERARGLFGDLVRRTWGRPSLHVVQPAEIIDLQAEGKKRRVEAFLQQKAQEPALTDEEILARIESYTNPPPLSEMVEGPHFRSEIATLKSLQLKIDKRFTIRDGRNRIVALPDEDPIIAQLKRDVRNASRRANYHRKKEQFEEAQKHARDFFETKLYLFDYLKEQRQPQIDLIQEQKRTRTLIEDDWIEGYLEKESRMDTILAEDAKIKAARNELVDGYLESQKRQEDVWAESHRNKSDMEVEIERRQKIPLDEILRQDKKFQAALDAFFNPKPLQRLPVRRMPPVVVAPVPQFAPIKHMEVAPPHIPRPTFEPYIKMGRVQRPSFLRRHLSTVTAAGLGLGITIASLWGREANASVPVQEAVAPPEEPQATLVVAELPAVVPAQIMEDNRTLEQDKAKMVIGSDPIAEPTPEPDPESDEYGMLVVSEEEGQPVWKYSRMEIPPEASPELKEKLERRIARLNQLVNFRARQNGHDAAHPQFVLSGEEWYTRDILNPDQREQIKKVDQIPLEMEEYFDVLADGIMDPQNSPGE